MKKRKILSLVLTSLTAISLAACGSSSSETDTDKVTIEIFNIKTETASQIQNLIDEYEKDHADVEINLTTVGGGQDATAALKAKFASGDEPDIFMLAGLSDVKTYERYLADQTDTDLISKALPGTLDGATLDGKVLGAPVLIEGYGWMINQTIFEKAGIKVEDIKSFADFKKAVETLDSKKDELGLKGVFAYSGDQADTWVSNQMSSHFISEGFNNSLTETFEAKTFDFDVTGSKAMQDYVDLIVKYNAEPFQSMSYATSVQELFATGKAAIVHQGNWIVPTLNEMDPEFAKNDLAVLPTFGTGTNDGKYAVASSWYWGINKTKGEGNQKASEDFINWMYSNESAMDQVVNELGYIPAYSNFDKNQISDPVSKTFFSALNEDKYVPWLHNSYPDGWGQNVMGIELQKYAQAEITWEEFVNTIEKDWNDKRSN
ncbi:MAG: ABC transporter substrate-binding protein [Lactovum sp.]